MKKLLAVLLILPLSVGTLISAENTVGSVVQYFGKVKVFHKDKPTGQSVKKNMHPVLIDDFIRTKRDSSAAIKLDNGVKVLMKEKTQFDFADLKNMTLEEGMVVLNVKKTR